MACTCRSLSWILEISFFAWPRSLSSYLLGFCYVFVVLGLNLTLHARQTLYYWVVFSPLTVFFNFIFYWREIIWFLSVIRLSVPCVAVCALCGCQCLVWLSVLRNPASSRVTSKPTCFGFCLLGSIFKFKDFYLHLLFAVGGIIYPLFCGWFTSQFVASSSCYICREPVSTPGLQ